MNVNTEITMNFERIVFVFVIHTRRVLSYVIIIRKRGRVYLTYIVNSVYCVISWANIRVYFVIFFPETL